MKATLGLHRRISARPRQTRIRRAGRGLALVVVAALAAGTLPAADESNVIVLPIAASIVGVSPYFSDVRVFNTSHTDDVTVTATYRCFIATDGCPSSPPQFVRVLSPRESLSFDDIGASAFGAPGTAGAIEFSFTGQPEQVIVTSHLYATFPMPTVGMFVPGLELSRAFPDSVLTSVRNGGLGLGFRTNVGVFNPGDAAVSVTFALFDGSVAVGQSVKRTVGAHSGVQVNQIFREAGVETLTTSNGVVAVHAAGPVLSYASVVDTNTSDPYFVVGAKDPKTQPTIVPTPTAASSTPTPTQTHRATPTQTRRPHTRTPTPTSTLGPPTVTPTPTPTPGPPQTYAVTLHCIFSPSCPGLNYVLSPNTIHIHVGDTIKWIWGSGLCPGVHSVTSGIPSAPDGKFDSGTQTRPFTFSHTFTETGTFPYFCRPGHVESVRNCLTCGCVIQLVHETGTVIVDP